jgi:hypothetical protein
MDLHLAREKMLMFGCRQILPFWTFTKQVRQNQRSLWKGSDLIEDELEIQKAVELARDASKYYVLAKKTTDS